MDLKKPFFVALILSLVLVSCDNNLEESIFEEHNISKVIENDFHYRYGDVIVIDANHWSDEHVTLLFKDDEGLFCEATYQDEEWLMTFKDLGEHDFQSNLPEQVCRSFLRLGYRNPRFDILDCTNRVYEIKRKGIDHEVYDFRFMVELPDGSFSPIQLLINEDGLVLLDSRLGYNNQELFYWTDSTPFDFIHERYPGADIRSYANYVGHHQFIIMHDGILKTVQFEFQSSAFVWDETVYHIDNQEILPEKVINSYEQWKSENPEYLESIFDTILFKETSRGNCWGLQDTKRDDKVIAWFCADTVD